jgi:hypothetical protein
MAAEGGAQPKTGTGRIEKRVTRRTRRRLMVRYGTTEANKTAFTKNVSDTGLFLQTNSVLRPGTTLQVEVVFPDRSFKMWARVIWAKKVPPELAHILACGMGICFIDPPADWIEYYHSWSRRMGTV